MCVPPEGISDFFSTSHPVPHPTMNVPTFSVGLRRSGRFASTQAVLPPFVRSLFALITALLFVISAPAQSEPARGTIEGRVQNLVTGEYLNNARISVKGTSQV